MKNSTLTALQSNESQEWYTPRVYIEAARKVMGTIDLDPASCARANETVKAARYYSLENGENGLMYPWEGKIWLNPPYCKIGGKSNQARWSERLRNQYELGITVEAILLVNASTDTEWFQPLCDYLVCLTNHRIHFDNPAKEDADSPTHGSAFIYLGLHPERFHEVFKVFGKVMRSFSPPPPYVIRPELF